MALNPFQQLMYDWGRLKAYNAGQMMTLAGIPDLNRWNLAANRVLQAIGIGRPSFSGDAVSFEPAEVSLQSACTDFVTLATTQLALPFSADQIPIRFFLLPDAPDRYSLLTIYDHWLADSYSIRNIMCLLRQAYGQPDAALQNVPSMTACDHRHYFGRRLAPAIALRDWLFSARDYWRHRSAYRMGISDPTDFTCGFDFHRLPAGLISALRHTAKRQSATVHDLFLASLAVAMGEFTAPHRAKPRSRRLHPPRRAIALGTIVDIRNQAHPSLDNIFGMYLSCYATVLQAPEACNAQHLVQQIARRSRKVKQSAEAVRAFDSFAVAQFWWRRYRQARHHADFFAKNLPTVAGISNVNLTGTWCNPPVPDAAGLPAVLDYVRISPTGPLSPLVLTLTTIGSELTLATTWRTMAINRQQASQIIERFKSVLVEFAS